MAMSTSPIHCSNCDETEDILECKGCLQVFCFKHLPNHREAINEQLNQLQDNCNLFRETIFDQKNEINNRYLVKKINQWEQESIDKIQQIANKCRERIINYTNESIIEIENNLNDLNEQSKQVCKENRLNEILLNQLIKKLENLKEELDQPSKVLFKQQSTSFINKINIITPCNKYVKREQDGLTIAGGNDEGHQLNQFSRPIDIAIDDDQTIYIADYYNHRIVEWKSNATIGRIVAGGNGPGKGTNQLDHPINVIIDKKK